MIDVLDPRLITAAIAFVGIAAMLLTLAAAVRHGLSLLALEVRVRSLREMQRQQLIAKGAIAADEDEITGVDIVDEDELALDASPEATEPRRQAA